MTPDFNFGTGDFTIEWFQYQTDSNSYPRIFQIAQEHQSVSLSNEVSFTIGKMVLPLVVHI